MLAWWESLSTFSQVLAAMAIPTTLILLIQTVLMLLGLGGDGGSDIDADGGDAGDGIFGDGMPDGDADPSGIDGLRIFSVRGIIAFFVVFGWLGIAMDSAGINRAVSILVSVAGGFAVMLIVAVIFRAVMKLESDGNIDIRNALGVSGTVYLKIPPMRNGSGKVNVMIQGTLCECDAVTDEEEAIPTGSEIAVMSLSGQSTLVVRKK